MYNSEVQEVGSDPLEAQIRGIRSHIHLCGHTHLSYSFVIFIHTYITYMYIIYNIHLAYVTYIVYMPSLKYMKYLYNQYMYISRQAIYTRDAGSACNPGRTRTSAVGVWGVSAPRVAALCLVHLPPGTYSAAIYVTPAGLEPAIPGFVGRCLIIHWATGPLLLEPSCLPAGLFFHP